MNLNGTMDIFALGREVEAHVAAQWEAVLEKHGEKLLDAYARGGDMAYGTYLDLLFRPVHKQMKANGLKPKPRLPGEFNISREWGTPEETDQERWMWSTILDSTGTPTGTLVTVIYHDHTQFRVPRQPGVIALAEVGKEQVVAALSAREPEFASALEFTEEYALYLQTLEQSERQANNGE